MASEGKRLVRALKRAREDAATARRGGPLAHGLLAWRVERAEAALAAYAERKRQRKAETLTRRARAR